ncbi:HD domain protein [Clostridium celatum DSM 1785]|uniref:HD domain protein n=1 Tax=Clostridium celatum DSM 1785 TaxID=545697 RepID=L1QK45_9CLOT|nr:HD domain protein [Clostridium celatum DSM 1785]
MVIYSRIIAEGLGLDIEDKNNLVYGAYLHDIGKINISKEILNKKGKLTDEEWNELKQHPENGVEIIKPVKSLEKVIPLILHHHERYDGKGYPYNLKGEEIPYLSRILTIADSFDAMTSSRPYNIRKSYDEALEELKRCKGLQFDPELVDKFIEILSTHSDNALINDIRAIK